MECNVEVTNDCPHRYVCIATARRPNEGFCICNRWFGFYGPGCRQLSAATYLLATMQSLALVAFAYAAYHVFLTGRMLPRRKLFFAAVVRTLVLCSCSLLLNGAFSVGALVFLSGKDPNEVFYEIIFWPGQVLMIFFFVLSVLSLALMWLEVMATVMIPQVQEDAADMEHTLWRVSRYRWAVYAAALTFTMGAVGIVERTHSTAYFSLLSLFYIVAVGVCFLFTGSDLTSQLQLPRDAEDENPMRISAAATSLKLTKSVFMHHMALAGLMVAIAFTVPTRTPIYAGQNSLPRFLQGQIPASLAQAVISLLLARVARYLRASEGKRVAPMRILRPSCSDIEENVGKDPDEQGPKHYRRSRKPQPEKFELDLPAVVELSEVESGCDAGAGGAGAVL